MSKDPAVDASRRFALAVALLMGTAAGLASTGGGRRAVEIAAVAAAAILACAVPRITVGAQLVGAASYLVIEGVSGRMNTDNAWVQALFVVAIAAAVGAAGSAGHGQRRHREELERALHAADRAARGDVVDQELDRRRIAPVEYELERARRHDRRVSVLAVVPDGGAGDTDAMRRIAAAIAESLRRSDVALREEVQSFTLVLPETGPVDARTVAERIRLAVTQEGLSVSIGVAGFPADGSGEQVLLEAARDAVRHARELGGNRTILRSVPVGAPAGWGVEPPATARA
jgi:diguanylate cyclase (GGDEF)-like protein